MISPSAARLAARALPVAALALLAAAGPAHGQFWKKVKKTVKDAAEAETLTQVDRVVRGQVQCVFDDVQCIEQAQSEGEDVVLTDDDGEVLTNDAGEPVSDPSEAEAIVNATPPLRPGEGAWANYDFVPGDELILYEDFTRDAVGDFPHGLDLVQGSFEIVEWNGGRYLRATSGGALAIPLPRTLPERFTLETGVSLTHGNAYLRVTPGRAYHGPSRTYKGTAVSVEASRAGVRPVSGQGPLVLTDHTGHPMREAVVPLRVMADGEHMKVYFGSERIANVPNALFPRGDTLFVNVSSASPKSPILIGPIRIAGGGRDLYDRLERDGRVATQGVLFASGSARLRPESGPTLKEIGEMLVAHPELRLGIEGHTDAEGEDAFNQDLSERRAAAVKDYLVSEFGIAADRLEAAGFGESRPVGDNATPEGKQQNRRVELVRL